MSSPTTTPNPDHETLRVQLMFPLEQVTKPIIWHLAHDFNLRFSIRRAQIDVKTGGYTVLELTGPRPQIEAGLAWVKAEGIEVSGIGLDGTDEWVI